MQGNERRREPRIHDEGVSLKLQSDGFDSITHTLNISASGLYCKVDKEIPIMTRLKLMLMLPDITKPGKPVKSIEIDGVVVRAHPVIIDGKTKHYDVAVFFDFIPPKSKEMINNYIARRPE